MNSEFENNNTLTFVKDFKKNWLIGFKEIDNYFILRQSRKLIFISKENNEEFEIKIELDNEYGYKRMETFKDIVLIAVHSKFDPENRLFGCPNFIELRAYTNKGILWSRKLNGWNLSVNYGGFHCLNDTIFLFEKVESKISLKKIDFVSGNELDQIKVNRFQDIATVNTNHEKFIKIQNQLFLIENNNLVKINSINNSLKKMIIFEKGVFKMCGNSNKFIGLYIEEHYKAIIYDIKKNTITDYINLKSGFDIKEIIINKDANKLIVTSDSHGNMISCFDLKLRKYIWRIQLDDMKMPLQLYIDNNNKLHVLFFSMEDEYNIYDIENGKELFSLKKDLGAPYFYDSQNIFLQYKNSLNQFKLN